MKTKKITKKIPRGFTKKEFLNEYNDQPLFKDKLDRANKILKNVGLPKT